MESTLTFYCKAFEELHLRELYDIMILRQRVFVVEQNCPYLDADGLDADSYHLMGIQNGALVAYARLLPKGLSYPDYASIGRVITAPEARRTGMGKLLMDEALQAAHRLFGVGPLKISAQCYLIRFYEVFGFETIGAQYLEDDIPHIAMLRPSSPAGSH
ncbi:MAG: GNAT family N-acetyltransferase [Phaeodactylibacter sp.]|nr:GNAT family N-acetyltransferase [Phaeodactylibacter sp.]